MICDYEIIKTLIETLIPKETFWQSQWFAALVGGFVGFMGTGFLNFFHNKREDKIHLRDKREDVYKQLLTIIIPIYNSWILSKSDKKVQKKPFDIEHIEILLNMYGSQKILRIFNDLPLTHWEISSETIDVIKKLKKQIRKEIGIKD